MAPLRHWFSRHEMRWPVTCGVLNIESLGDRGARRSSARVGGGRRQGTHLARPPLQLLARRRAGAGGHA
eukprot:5550746-Prymnesium_polylepis.1